MEHFSDHLGERIERKIERERVAPVFHKKLYLP